jgi:hypothetical protein
MQAIRQMIATRKLRDIIDIPDDFSSDTVEVIILPVAAPANAADVFNPEQFFGVSRIKNVEQLLAAQRDEWEQ